MEHESFVARSSYYAPHYRFLNFSEYQCMTHEQYWFVASIALFILEIITPGFVLANFGVACLASAAAAWLGATVPVQVMVFVIVCIISFVTLRPLMQRFIYRNQARARTGTEALVGQMGLVTEAIIEAPVGGRVQLGGDNWHAVADDGLPIPRDTRIVVIRVDSTTLVVRRQD
jgi:membrane protein implicated in regulation of membrane protease activity